MLRVVAEGNFWLSPNRERSAAGMLRERFGVSQRRACRVVGFSRSTQRLAAPPVTDEEAELREFLGSFAKARPRWGWRRAATQARREGWQVNDKRVRRLWRDRRAARADQAAQEAPDGCRRARGCDVPIRPNVLWALDFQFDTTVEGRTLKMLNVIDEFTRECLATAVDRSIGSDQVVAVLGRLAAQRGGAPVEGDITAESFYEAATTGKAP